MEWVTWIIVVLVSVLGLLAITAAGFHLYIVIRYIPVVKRIFQEMPPFKMPLADPIPGAEELTISAKDGVALQGCYLKTPNPRRGVILFGIEFQSNCWSCQHYVDFLLEAGYDICAIEMRGQGKSPAPPGYVPLQWVTEFEVRDFEAAVAYLKSRSDRHPAGIGFFGLSKGASAGMVVAARDPFIRCCVTDGLFATLTTMVPYMQHFIHIYTTTPLLARVIPKWYYRVAAKVAIARVGKERKVRYSHLESYLHRFAPRPLLMIHGGGDKYIKPEMAKTLFGLARETKELWIVDSAKHNQAIQIAGDAYRQRVREFFDRHLANQAPPALPSSPHAPSVNGVVRKSDIPDPANAKS